MFNVKIVETDLVIIFSKDIFAQKWIEFCRENFYQKL